MVRSQDVNPVRQRAEHLIGLRAKLILKPYTLLRPIEGIVRVVDDYGLTLQEPNRAYETGWRWEQIEEVRGLFGAAS